MFAARALSNPVVQEAAHQAVYAGANTAIAAVTTIARQPTSPALYIFIGAGTTALLVASLLSACACAGSLAGVAVWRYGCQPQTARRAPEEEALLKLAQMADHLTRGGHLAQEVVANRLHLDPATVATWHADWRRVTEGPGGTTRSQQQEQPKQQARHSQRQWGGQ